MPIVNGRYVSADAANAARRRTVVKPVKPVQPKSIAAGPIKTKYTSPAKGSVSTGGQKPGRVYGKPHPDTKVKPVMIGGTKYWVDGKGNHYSSPNK